MATDQMKTHPYPSMKKINLRQESALVTDSYRNVLAFAINDHCIRVAVMNGEYPWHRHLNSDECFMVLEGELEIEFTDGRTVCLAPWEMINIPSGVVHRTRSRKRTVNICFENMSAYDDAVFEDGPDRTMNEREKHG